MPERFYEWVHEEIKAMKGAKVAGALLLAIGVALGFWAGGLFYQQEIRVLERRLEIPGLQGATTDGPYIRGTLFKGIRTHAGVCDVTLDGRALADFADDYDVVLVCGITNTAVDKFEDPNVSVSSPFTIVAADIPITVAQTPEMQSVVNDIRARGREQNTKQVEISGNKPGHIAVTFTEINAWHEIGLVPRGSNRPIRTLGDVRRNGGKVGSVDVPMRTP